MKKILICLWVAVLGTVSPFSYARTLIDTPQTGGLFNAGEKPQLISRQFSFTEGASVDKKGNVFFTDQPNNKIWEYSREGKLTVWMDTAGRSNGTYFDKKGNLITCADEHDQLWSISPHKKVTVLLLDKRGVPFNGPNDVWVAPNGNMYMTDPYYQRDYWTRKKPDLPGQYVYLVRKGKNGLLNVQLYEVETTLEQPNGIVGTPDGKYLYVADIKANKTYKYTISPDGGLINKKLFTAQGSDGMTLDEKGNVYLTGDGVTVYDPSGNKLAHIQIDEPWTANLCFGGKNKDELFICASKAIYILHMKVRGVE